MTTPPAARSPAAGYALPACPRTWSPAAALPRLRCRASSHPHQAGTQVLCQQLHPLASSCQGTMKWRRAYNKGENMICFGVEQVQQGNISSNCSSSSSGISHVTLRTKAAPRWQKLGRHLLAGRQQDVDLRRVLHKKRQHAAAGRRAPVPEALLLPHHRRRALTSGKHHISSQDHLQATLPTQLACTHDTELLL